MTARSHSRDPGLHRQLQAVLEEAGNYLQIPVHDAEVLRLHSNAVFALPSADLVIRIAGNPDARERIADSVRITRWLSGHGFPCVAPANITGQPFTVQGKVVSAWRLEHTASRPPGTATDLARLLRDLHERPLPADPPDHLDNPLAGVAEAVSRTPEAMTGEDQSWLMARIGELREQWQHLTFPHPPCLIHGDAHPNNLMRLSSGRVIIGDWDHVSVGPREWDLVQVHYFSRRFGHPAAQEIDGFTTAYGWDVRSWPGLDTLIAVREISGLSPYIRTATVNTFSRDELAHRLQTLRSADIKASWNSPSE